MSICGNFISCCTCPAYFVLVSASQKSQSSLSQISLVLCSIFFLNVELCFQIWFITMSVSPWNNMQSRYDSINISKLTGILLIQSWPDCQNVYSLFTSCSCYALPMKTVIQVYLCLCCSASDFRVSASLLHSTRSSSQYLRSVLMAGHISSAKL